MTKSTNNNKQVDILRTIRFQFLRVFLVSSHLHTRNNSHPLATLFQGGRKARFRRKWLLFGHDPRGVADAVLNIFQFNVGRFLLQMINHPVRYLTLNRKEKLIQNYRVYYLVRIKKLFAKIRRNVAADVGHEKFNEPFLEASLFIFRPFQPSVDTNRQF